MSHIEELFDEEEERAHDRWPSQDEEEFLASQKVETLEEQNSRIQRETAHLSNYPPGFDPSTLD